MNQYFELEPKEKKQEWLLLTLAILFFLTVATGIYYQSRNKDHDNILIPLFFILGSCFFLVYSINAFGKGNLIQKWTPFYIYKILFFLTKRLSSSADDNAKRFAIKFLGVIALIISIALFITAIKSTGII
jgi:uncharacterized membrane protein